MQQLQAFTSDQAIIPSTQVQAEMLEKDAAVLGLAQEIVALARSRGWGEHYAGDACRIAAVLCSTNYVYGGGN